MPLGVDHIVNALRPFVIMLKKPLMPLGVDHGFMVTLRVLNMVSEITFDAVRR